MAHHHHRTTPTADAVRQLARRTLGDWVGVEVHGHLPLYCWRNTALFDPFGEIVGRLKSNTIYLNDSSPWPVDDLFHEIGHAVARRFDLVGHHDNGFNGHWERQQRRLVGCVSAGRHWSRLLTQIQRTAPPFTPDLASEIWAELFMCWFLYPEVEESTFISAEMRRLRDEPALAAIHDLAKTLGPGGCHPG